MRSFDQVGFWLNFIDQVKVSWKYSKRFSNYCNKFLEKEREVVIPLLLRQEIYTGYDDIHIDFLIFMHKYSLFDPKLPWFFSFITA